jgi:hypothetical protein
LKASTHRASRASPLGMGACKLDKIKLLGSVSGRTEPGLLQP